MKESELRKHHRQMGIILAIFLFVQALTGMGISLGDIILSGDQAVAESVGESDTQKLGQASTDQMDEEGFIMEIMEDLHHGGGSLGGYYRIALGILVMVQTIMGGIIYLKIKQRTHR